MRSDREKMEYDVVIVGAGPAGLSSAIKLKQLAKINNRELSVCIVEKGPEVGAHILSGAVFETKALEELFPNWKDMSHPTMSPVVQEKFIFLSESKSIRLPNFLLPKSMKNHNNFIISLSNMCRWLAGEAENLGVEIYPGFAAKEILFDEKDSVIGIATGDMGVDKDFVKSSSFEPGIELIGKYTLFAEGCRGHLGKQLINKFNLSENSDPQQYGIGLKEIWEVPEENHDEGMVLHSVGWPLENDTYGGSFVYHAENKQIYLGYVIGLDYSNPYLSPFEEFQRFKTHPAIKKMLSGGKRISYGARALIEGGLQSLPKMYMPGALLIGCDAGTLNMPKIKGSHTAMKSGILAAEAINEFISERVSDLSVYEEKFNSSWLYKELHAARNVKPFFTRFGTMLGVMLAGIDQWLFWGKMPFTLSHKHADHETLIKAKDAKKIEYPKPDGVLTFDRSSSVYLTGTYHTENQPVHLQLKDSELPISYTLNEYDEPSQRYCPVGVYEVHQDNESETPRFVINSQNCIHCKTCDIKEPSQNITWVTPEGGGGPKYGNM